MPKEFLNDVLQKLAEVTSILVETSKIKEDLDKSFVSQKDLLDILERTKSQVDFLSEQSADIKDLFHDNYTETRRKLKDQTSEPHNGANTETKPLIKVVDIKTLVGPAAVARKPVQDDSVVIITSSDEEPPKSPVKRTPFKRQAAQKTIQKTRKILQDSHSDSDLSPEEIIGKRRHKEIEKTKLRESSSSDDEYTFSRLKTKPSKQKRDKESSEPITKDDKKINAECYVHLVRVPCEKLKDYYLNKLELLTVNKITDLSSLKRKRATKRSLNNNKKTESAKNTTVADQTSSDSEDIPPETNQSAAVMETNAEINKNLEDLAASALELLNSDKGNSSGEENSSMEDSLLLFNPDKAKKSSTPKETSKSADSHITIDDSMAEESEQKQSKSTAEESKTKEDPEVKENDSKEAESSKDAWKKDKLLTETFDSSDSDASKTANKAKKKDKENYSSNKEAKTAKDAWKRDKLLSGKFDSSESEDELAKFKKKKAKMQETISSDDEPKLPKDKVQRIMKKNKRKKVIIDSDSDRSKNESSEKSESSESEKEEEKTPEKPKRRRVKRVRDSSDESEDNKSTRKQIRSIIGRDSLAETTLKAEAEERERKARISERQRKYNQTYEANAEINAKVDKVVLDYDDKNKEELLKVDDSLVSKLKPHQASGIQFMWDACFESLERSKTKGSGCILAHCMGLGKTLQVIALSHTLLVNSEKTNVRKILVVSPLNTVLNWVNEFKQWLPDQDDFEIFELVSFKQNHERQYQTNLWHKHGGVLIIGYDMFRNLSNPENKRLSRKMRTVFQEALVDPGPDLVICDEGHLLKNEKTNLSIAMNRIRTLRRIVLTGTPLQNNLKEYFCMVQFIKPNLLGTYKEYLNRFVNPIINGQYTDSTPHDINIMRKRSHVLHKMLDGVVQRRDYSVLEPYLPPKHDYVVFLKLTDTQIKLYQYYMDHFARKNTDGSNRTSFLFVDFQALQRICTHPRVLLDKSIEMKLAKEKRDDSDESEGSLKDFINDDEEEESTNSSGSSSNDDDDDNGKPKAAPRKRITRAAAALAGNDIETIELHESPEEKEWWQEFCDGDQLDVITNSSKLSLLFEILKECEQIGDKVLVFSQSLYSLNVIEYFLGKVHDATQAGDTDSVGGYTGSWCLGLDYFRLDGSSSCDNRNHWCKTFNDPDNIRARLFLISTRAGGLGINLVSANRVVIFDVSWNPSHDIQSIYRVYRFGQKKPCYIYRFVTQGTMEMKIYERQVTKQAISKRVIDEQQIDRHYNQNDLAELYKFEPDPGERETPNVPKDVLLAELLQKFEDKIYRYHEHQSLLENKEDEVLNEEERKAAWEEFENEKKQRNNLGGPVSWYLFDMALASLVRQENPAIMETQVKQMVPILKQTIQEQVAKGDMLMMSRVQQEAFRLQMLQAQRYKEQRYQQQMMQQMIQQRHFENMLNSVGNPGPSRNATANTDPSDTINLFD